MTIETLQTVSFICFLLAAVFFLVTVAMFFLLNIAKVVGDLSGITARKAIENIRNQNDGTAHREQRREEQKHTSQISMSTKLKNSGAQGFAQTSKLSTSKLRQEAEETTVLSMADIVSEETTVLSPSAANETTVLNGSYAETTVLTPEQNIIAPTEDSHPVNVQRNLFSIDYEIWFTASTEIIR